ncbi:MAG TPA: Fur family transcriptional regulator [Solirubrobacteraceae bacterium]|nr:Fur family transcriptional regulator [Solirubrobacteraceae bacterium]
MDTGWAEHAREEIRRGGHNRGAARDALIDVFARNGCALTAQEIEHQLQRERPVGRASIYRALELLHGMHLITRVDVGDGTARYERAHVGHDHHHHHLVCERCGTLVAFDDPELEAAIHKLNDRFGFDASEHEVTLRGACPECR